MAGYKIYLNFMGIINFHPFKTTVNIQLLLGSSVYKAAML